MVCSIDDLKATMADWLSDTYGRCVKNYELSFVEVPSVTHAAAMKFLKDEAAKLLEKAVAEHKKFEADIEKHKLDKDATKLHAIQMDSHKWMNKNINAKGYVLNFNIMTGEPISISTQSLAFA